MPYNTYCVFCQRNMSITDSGKYPPICTICWGSYPNDLKWEQGLGLKIAKLLKSDGIIGIDNFS